MGLIVARIDYVMPQKSVYLFGAQIHLIMIDYMPRPLYYGKEWVYKTIIIIKSNQYYLLIMLCKIDMIKCLMK